MTCPGVRPGSIGVADTSCVTGEISVSEFCGLKQNLLVAKKMATAMYRIDAILEKYILKGNNSSF